MTTKFRVVGITLSTALIATLAMAASTTPAQAATSVPTAPTGWTTTFTDSFDGSASSRLGSDWQYRLGTSYAGGAANWGTGQVETSTDDPANVSMDGNGHLNITALRDPAGAWTSARVETDSTNFEAAPGGMMEMTASIKQPNPASAVGYWPAFWALGAAARPVAASNWPSVGELDILEDVNGLSQVSNTFHCGVWAQPPCNEPEGIGSGLMPVAGAQTGYHTYSVIVDRTNTAAEQLRFLTDGVVKYTVNESQVGESIWSAAVDHGFFMILNLAIGGSYPDKVCGCYSAGATPTSGATMSVDYVAVYNKAGSGSGTAPIPTPTPAPTSTPTSSPTPTPSPSPVASGVTLAWPTSDTIMRSGQEVGIWGTTQSPTNSAAQVAIQNKSNSLWAHGDGSWGAQQWLSAPTVDPQGTWRLMYTPNTAGNFTATARENAGSPASSEVSTPFSVIN
jgi:hypothetical protein